MLIVCENVVRREKQCSETHIEKYYNYQLDFVKSIIVLSSGTEDGWRREDAKLRCAVMYVIFIIHHIWSEALVTNLHTFSHQCLVGIQCNIHK